MLAVPVLQLYSFRSRGPLSRRWVGARHERAQGLSRRPGKGYHRPTWSVR